MFEALSDKLQAIFDRLGKRGILTEQDVDAALREVRVALLEADVNFRVVKDFLARVRERAVGAEVHKSLTPGQAVVKIVHEELLRTLVRQDDDRSEAGAALAQQRPPADARRSRHLPPGCHHPARNPRQTDRHPRLL
jgi:signal recognition particle GTPase